MWTRRRGRSAFLSLVLTAGILCIAIPSHAAEIRLFAAASTTTAVQEVIRLYQAGNPDDRVLPSFAASSTLAKQVVNGAPADIFLSASRQWIDYVVAEGAADPAAATDLLGNRLVLIAPADTTWSLEIGPGMDLAGRLGDGYLAMGDPDHVPAGIYGREALTALGLWRDLSPRVARAANVRAALVLVERGEAAAGIVYATDAAISRKVRVVGVFPPSSHSPIVYPAAVIAGAATPEVDRFFRFLASPEARKAWTRQGFTLLTGAQEG